MRKLFLVNVEHVMFVCMMYTYHHVTSGCNRSAQFCSSSNLNPHLVYSCSPVVNMIVVGFLLLTSAYPAYESGGRNSSNHLILYGFNASNNFNVYDTVNAI